MANFDLGITHDITLSDTANDKFDWIMVTGTAGSVIVEHEGGNTTTLSAVPVGVWVAVSKGLNVTTASTAVGIMGV